MTHSPPPPVCESTSRRSALHTLTGLGGWAALAAGWPLPLKTAPAALNAASNNAAESPRGASDGEPPATRLVTVGGGITEVVHALGAQAQLVGSDTTGTPTQGFRNTKTCLRAHGGVAHPRDTARYRCGVRLALGANPPFRHVPKSLCRRTSVYPAAALTTPKVGYMRQLSAEGLLSLRPGAVVASSDAGPPVVLGQLRSAGVRVEPVSSDHTWGEVQRKVAAVGRAAGRDNRATQWLAELNQQRAQVQEEVQVWVRRRNAAPKPKWLFVLSHSNSLQESGEGTAAHAMIEFVGARNALAGFNGYRPLTAEAMAAAAPEVIVTTTQGIEALGGVEHFWQRPEMVLTPAYQRRGQAQTQVHLDALELLGFGPRLPQTVQRLHHQVVAA